MAKLVLSDLASLANQTSAITTINNNSAAIETAMENTLSRDGTAPNTMGASLDMNSNRILNLPAASAGTEPVRKQEFTALVPDLTALAAAAAASATSSATSATNSATSASSSSSSASAAATSATNAATSATNAATSALSAANAIGAIGPRGPQGPTGPIALTARGTWSSSTAYVQGDWVTHSNSGWYALIPNTNVTPGTSAPTWRELTGAVTDGREILTGNRTYYVATTGSDSNNGLTSLTPFLTVQKAVDVIHAGVDMGGFSIGIELAAGTYNNFALFGHDAFLGNTVITIAGATGNPADVILDGGGTSLLVFAKDYCALNFNYVTFTNATGACISAGQDGIIDFSTCIFGTCPGGTHITASDGGVINVLGPYSVTGAAAIHLGVAGGIINMGGQIATIAGGLNFSVAFAYASNNGYITGCNSSTFIGAGGIGGSSTGVRAAEFDGGRILTSELPDNVFPGNSTSTSTTKPRTFVLYFTRDMTAASGNVAYTGVGFRPRSVHFIAVHTTSNAYSEGIDTYGQLGAGKCIGWRGDTQATSVINAKSISINLDGTNAQSANVSLFGLDGFTLSWTKENSPTGTANIMAYCIG